MSKQITLYALAFILPSMAAHAGGFAEEWIEPGAVISKERCAYVAGIYSDNPACVPPTIGKATKGGDPVKERGKDPDKVRPKDPGKDPGKEPEKDPGKDPDQDPGKDPGKDPNEDPC